MAVSTKLFGAFFLLVFVAYYAVLRLMGDRTKKATLPVLVAAAFASCAYAGRSLLWVPVLLILLSYGLGRALAGARRAKNQTPRLLLAVTILALLWPLLFFKYSGVFGLPAGHIFPVGLSFYTLQSITYAVAVAQGKIKEERSLLTVAAFVLFFPVLTSGPILRAEELLPQLAAEKTFSYDEITAGLRRWAVGLFKKLVIADGLAMYIAQVRGVGEAAPGTAQLVAAVLYSFQIYLDFSGYTDIAAGSAQMLGFTVRENFDHPYLSASVSAFWRRWHLSLSSWLRDYVYIPLGGSRRGAFRTYVNLLLTFVVSGLWHGTGLTFLVWGLLHGAALCAERALGFAKEEGARILRILLTFAYVTFAWIFFAAENVREALTAIASFGRIPRELRDLPLQDALLLPAEGLGATLVFLVLFCALSAGTKAVGERGDILLGVAPERLRWLCYFALIFGILFFRAAAPVSFIYHQF